MRYVIYKLYFYNGVHFGKNALENSEYTFCADTLFSALCQEAVKESKSRLEYLLDYVKSGQIIFSDAFPLKENEYFLPKPFLYINHGQQTGDSSVKKAYKKMKYIPCDSYEEYLKGKLMPDKTDGLREFGNTYRKVSLSIRGEQETKPYRVGVYYYNEGNGLYVIAGTESEDAETLMEELLESLSYSGIGGKRSSGLGRFNFYKAAVPDFIEKRMKGTWEKYMTLSVSLPKEEEMKQVMENANYSLMKRSGFVASENYAKEQLRKKDLYVFTAGSCFDRKYSGDIYDVSNHGQHSVYRYAMPMFMGVNV